MNHYHQWFPENKNVTSVMTNSCERWALARHRLLTSKMSQPELHLTSLQKPKLNRKAGRMDRFSQRFFPDRWQNMAKRITTRRKNTFVFSGVPIQVILGILAVGHWGIFIPKRCGLKEGWWKNYPWPSSTRWWFQRFVISTYSPLTWGNDPIWLIFFRWVMTSNSLGMQFAEGWRKTDWRKKKSQPMNSLLESPWAFSWL